VSDIFHVERDIITYSWDGGFLCPSEHDISADEQTDRNESQNDPVADPRPVESFVVGPWLDITVEKFS
jgi:hypothetical protein